MAPAIYSLGGGAGGGNAQQQSTSASQTPLISPAELSYLFESLSLPAPEGPIRPDGRSPTQFRPLIAETSILPGANGSARIGFADGTEAIVGVKAEVERTVFGGHDNSNTYRQEDYLDKDGGGESLTSATTMMGQGSWVQMSIEIPGFRDDDALPVFLAEMMREALVGHSTASTSAATVAGRDEEDEDDNSHNGDGKQVQGGLKVRLVINRKWHWRLYIDILLLSPPLSYPLPLMSLTTHLALLSTKLPKLKSTGEEDPFFDDDWAAAEYLYPRRITTSTSPSLLSPIRPPVTLLVISAGDNIIFDPSREEIAVADSVFAVSIGREEKARHRGDNHQHQHTKMKGGSQLKLLSIRTIDPPSRLTNPGVPDSENVTTFRSTTATDEADTTHSSVHGQIEDISGVWKPRRGGVKRQLVSKMVKIVLEKGGVGEEVMEGLERVNLS